MKQEEIIFELDYKLGDKLVGLALNNNLNFNFNYLPFNKFTIRETIPKNEKEKVDFEGIIKNNPHFKNTLSKEQINKAIKELKDDLINFEIKASIENLEIKIEDNIGSFCINFEDEIISGGWVKEGKFKLYSNSNQDIERFNNIDYQNGILINLCKVIGLLSYLQKPNKIETINKRTNLQIDTNKKHKRSKSKSNKKTYLYKTVYSLNKFDNDNESTALDDVSDSKRVYNRKTEEWLQRGHWRTFKNGNRTWIESTMKKSKLPVISTDNSNSKTYKMSRLDL